MTELTDRPLKRGIPIMCCYVNLTESGIEIKVRNSRRRGLFIHWAEVIDHAAVPDDRPAKISAPREYLDWVASKRRPQKQHAKQPGLSEIGRHA